MQSDLSADQLPLSAIGEGVNYILIVIVCELVPIVYVHALASFLFLEDVICFPSYILIHEITKLTSSSRMVFAKLEKP